ncbi:MAG: hypothetical protein KL787_01465 [Taibaiella sp.]|nr:hypothetical protein [Taibaiella sp.]
MSITILLSEKANDYNELKRVSDLYPNVELIGFTDNLVKLFSENDIAIINGGLTRYEASVVGIPFLAISIHKKTV